AGEVSRVHEAPWVTTVGPGGADRYLGVLEPGDEPVQDLLTQAEGRERHVSGRTLSEGKSLLVGAREAECKSVLLVYRLAVVVKALVESRQGAATVLVALGVEGGRVLQRRAQLLPDLLGLGALVVEVQAEGI